MARPRHRTRGRFLTRRPRLCRSTTVLRNGQIVALCALALLSIGAVMVASAGQEVTPIDEAGVSVIAPDGFGPARVADMLGSMVFSRSGAYVLLAGLAMLACAMLPIRRVVAWSLTQRPGGFVAPTDGFVVLGLGVATLVGVLLLVYLPGLGHSGNGSERWIRLPIAGGLSVQPSEIVKWGLVALLAWFAARRAYRMSHPILGFAPAIAALGLVAGIVAKEDLGTAVLIAGASTVVLIAGGARLTHFVMLTPAAAVGLFLALQHASYRIVRILAFLDPYSDPDRSGYHMIQSMAAVAGGHGWGRGLGHGLQKFGYLPEDTNDFLFAIICEELGVAGAVLVVSLYCCLLWAGSRIVRAERDLALKLFGLGVLATIGGQTLINIGVVTGLGPTKGIALPMVSAGGTGWVLTAAALGVLIHLDRTQLKPDALPSSDDAPEPTPGAAIA